MIAVASHICKTVGNRKRFCESPPEKMIISQAGRNNMNQPISFKRPNWPEPWLGPWRYCLNIHGIDLTEHIRAIIRKCWPPRGEEVVSGYRHSVGVTKVTFNQVKAS